jgi:hypothetical protein
MVLIGSPARAATEAQRRDHLDWMLKNLPDAPLGASGSRKPARFRPISIRCRARIFSRTRSSFTTAAP